MVEKCFLDRLCQRRAFYKCLSLLKPRLYQGRNAKFISSIQPIFNIDSKWAHFVNKTIRKVIAITDFCQNKVILKVFLTG